MLQGHLHLVLVCLPTVMQTGKLSDPNCCFPHLSSACWSNYSLYMNHRDLNSQLKLKINIFINARPSFARVCLINILLAIEDLWRGLLCMLQSCICEFKSLWYESSCLGIRGGVQFCEKISFQRSSFVKKFPGWLQVDCHWNILNWGDARCFNAAIAKWEAQGNQIN